MKRYLLLALAAASISWSQTYDIALITSSRTSEHWKTVYAGALKAQEELKAQGITVRLQWEAAPTATHVEEQKQIVQQMVAKHVHGIVLAPCDVRALVAPVEAAAKAKIPTVVIDARLATSAQTSFVGTDNFKGGVLGAKRLGTLLGGKGNVALLRAQKGRASTDQREEGFLSAMKSQFPGIRVISADHYAGGTMEQSEQSAADLLKASGAELQGVFSSNSTSSLGLLSALRKAGLAKGKVKFVCFDANTQSLEAIKAGDIQGIVAQNPFEIGHLGIKTLVAHLKGTPVEPEIETPCVMITPENIESAAITALLRTKTASSK